MKLTDFSILRKSKSLLPVNIFIDEVGVYINCKHNKLIKFQTDYDDRPQTDSNFSSMILDGNVVESTLPTKVEISNKDIKKVSNFVVNNSELLSLVADFELDFDDFKDLMIKGGEKATKEELDIQKERLNKILSNENRT